MFVLPSLVFLVVGFLPAILTFALRPNAVQAIGLDQVPLPAWLFVLVWVIIYPSLGMSAWVVWQQVPVHAHSIPLVMLVAALLQTTSFWWTDSLRTTAIVDATGILFAALTLFIVAQFSTAAALWTLPFLIWMPITFSVKLAALMQPRRSIPLSHS